jgi:chemotaxis receptor (MCP) glutamine deamidase CheD
MVRQELEKHGIRIVRQVVGGTSGRNIKFDTKNDSIFVKSTGNSEFKKIT